MNLRWMLVTVAAGVVALTAAGCWAARPQGALMLHDLSTDTADPPAFVAVLPLRATAPNPATYGGPAVAAAQHVQYPTLAPLLLAATPAAVFEAALDLVKARGWALDGFDRPSGRIEATATTRWMRFQDDVVIRIGSEGARGSRVDMRSVSRVGQSDLGTNARRIERFLADLNKTLQAPKRLRS